MTDRAPAAGSRWHYRAADARGVTATGEIDASSERDAIDALRRRDLWVTDLSPVSRPGHAASPTSREHSALPADSRWRPRRNPSRTEFAVMIRAMAMLLGAGVPLDRALAYAAAQASSADARNAFAAVREAVRGGESLSAAVARQPLFPTLFGPTLAASEASGTLDATLTMLADQLDRDAAVRSRLQSALIYPSILALASVVGVSVILLVVVPRFAALITDGGGTLPLSTRLLVAMSGALMRGWWLILIVTLLSALGWRRWLTGPDQQRRWHAARLAWPVTGALERMQAAARYTSTLSVALKSGVSLLGAMALARGVVSNRSLAAALEAAEALVRDGGTLASGLDRVLPPLAVRLLDAGEVGGDVAGMAGRAAAAADADVQLAIGRAMALVEPVMILGFGGVVGFVALALLQAIYGINARSL